MYYRRWLSEDVMNLLRPQGALHFLVQLARQHTLPRYPGIRLDLQLRNEEAPNEVVSLYAGKTAILNVAFKADGRVELRAADSYRRQSCAGVLRSYSRHDLPETFESDVLRYLNEVRIGPKWISKEGKLQNDLARRFSVDALADDEFVIFDSEPNVGGRDGKDILGEIQQFFRTGLVNLAAESRKPFFHPHDLTSMGSEADFFAVGKNNTLFVIEIKDPGAEDEIYFLPRQIGVYGMFWSRCAPSFIEDINRLVSQKEELGLISRESARRRLAAKDLTIAPVVIIGEHASNIPSPEIRDRYVQVREYFRRQQFSGTGGRPLTGLLEYKSTRRETCRLERLGW